MRINNQKIPPSFSPEETETILQQGLMPIESIVFNLFQLSKNTKLSSRTLRKKIKEIAQKLSDLEYGEESKSYECYWAHRALRAEKEIFNLKCKLAIEKWRNS